MDGPSEFYSRMFRMYDLFLRIAIGLALYEASRNAVLEKVPDARIEVKKTQISFFDRRMFAAVSFAPVRKAKDRPKPVLTISFGLTYRKKSDKIDVAAQRIRRGRCLIYNSF